MLHEKFKRGNCETEQNFSLVEPGEEKLAMKLMEIRTIDSL